MINCPECMHNNHDDRSTCEACGHHLPGGADFATVKVDSLQDLSDPSYARSQWSRGYTRREIALFLPANAHLPAYIYLQPGEKVILGRGDPAYREQPDVDLSLYNAADKGMSRVHARIECGEDAVILTDLVSTNGTFVNEKPLVSDQPCVLHDRDSIRFGKLEAHIIFQRFPTHSGYEIGEIEGSVDTYALPRLTKTRHQFVK